MHLPELTQFLFELSEQNNRAWFTMNRPRYDILRGEFLTLVTQLADAIGRFDSAIAQCDPKKALFRINRDLRFGHNRDPYKTHFAAALVPSGMKKPSQGGGPSYYFHVAAEGKLLYAAGEYLPPPNRLRAIRNRIVEDPASFSALLADRGLAKHFGVFQEEDKLARPPKGFPADGPHVEYLKLKSYIVWRELDVRKDFSSRLETYLPKEFRHALPLVEWLRSIKTPVEE